jgi:uncharacterized protein (DUF4415 family)
MNNKTKITPELKAMLKAAPEFTMEEAGVKPGKVVARGFAAFKEHINKNGRPKSADPKVGISIRIPRSYAERLRSTGRGWQTLVGEYLVKGIKKGDLVGIE